MHLALRAALAGTVILLSACGGGGGDVTATPGGGGGGGDPAPQGTTLSGIVAVGAPLTGAEVKSWCGDGSAGPTATTDAAGRYEMLMTAGCTAPWFLQATGTAFGAPPLYSFGGDPATIGPMFALNITPITTLFVDLVGDLSDLERALAAMRQASPPDLERVWQDILARVNTLDPVRLQPMTVEGLLNTKFDARPGDPVDDVLEAWAAQRGSVSTAALREQFGNSGGSLATRNPWKTLFTGDAPLVLSGTSCTSGGGAVADATATLRMVGGDLEVEMASSVFGAPQTFVVGPSARSDFRLDVRGDSPFVRVYAWRSSGVLFNVSDNAGTPSITMTAAGGTTSVSCTLANPVTRDALAGFEPAARVRSAVPATGASGTCPAFGYSVSSLGDVRFDGTSLPADWLDQAGARYYENVQFLLFGGPAPAFQVELVSGGKGIQPYYFHTVPYGLNCL